MPDYYERSAIRHLTDADHLAAKQAWNGAGYLIGYVVECAIKAFIEQARPAQGAPHKHLPQLISACRGAVRGRKQQHVFTLLTSRSLMEGWSVDLRYAADGTIPEETFRNWRKEAQRVLAATGIKKAIS